MSNISLNLNIPSARVSGRYKLTVRKSNGDIRLETDWFDNLITNTGLDALLSTDVYGDFASRCHIGSGSTTPSYTDTALVSQYATTTSRQSVDVTELTSPYRYSTTIVYRFAAVGAGVTRTIREIGTSSNSLETLVSRALILDSSGNPMTITMYEEEVLDATYEFTNVPALVDADYLQTITINSVEYSINWRASTVGGVSSSSWWGIPTGVSGNDGISSSLTTGTFYSGSVGATTTGPSGTSYGTTSYTSTYTPGTYSRTFTFGLGLNNANYVSGITAFRIGSLSDYRGAHLYQCGISPGIPKTENDTMKFTVTLSVARY